MRYLDEEGNSYGPAFEASLAIPVRVAREPQGGEVGSAAAMPPSLPVRSSIAVIRESPTLAMVPPVPAARPPLTQTPIAVRFAECTRPWSKLMPPVAGLPLRSLSHDQGDNVTNARDPRFTSVAASLAEIHGYRPRGVFVGRGVLDFHKVVGLHVFVHDYPTSMVWHHGVIRGDARIAFDSNAATGSTTVTFPRHAILVFCVVESMFQGRRFIVSEGPRKTLPTVYGARD